MSELEIFADPSDLAQQSAQRLVDHLAGVLKRRGEAHVCLTGGTIAARIYAEVASLADRIDWSRVHFWFGDERFVPAGHADRNDRGAENALGAAIWGVAQLHPMPASDQISDLDQAAASYAEQVAPVPFDLCLLGMGPDGHIASLFPDHPAALLTDSPPVVAVRNSPKPPPERMSLSFAVINRSAAVWLLVSGAEKAEAVAAAQSDDCRLPAALVHGTQSTCWLVDQAAASELTG